MGAGVKKSEIKAFVKRAVRELNREQDTHNGWIEGIYEKVDEWWGANVRTGRITDLDAAPSDDRDLQRLKDAVTIMWTAQDEGWGIADDSGLWEGLAPFPALMSQAYFTLEQAIGQQEPRDLR